MSSSTQDTRQTASRDERRISNIEDGHELRVDIDERLREDLSASRFRSSMFKSERTFEAHRTGLVTMENSNIVPRLSLLAAPA